MINKFHGNQNKKTEFQNLVAQVCKKNRVGHFYRLNRLFHPGVILKILSNFFRSLASPSIGMGETMLALKEMGVNLFYRITIT